MTEFEHFDGGFKRPVLERTDLAQYAFDRTTRRLSISDPSLQRLPRHNIVSQPEEEERDDVRESE